MSVEPIRCHLCGISVVIQDGVTAEAAYDPDQTIEFEDLIEHECSESEDLED
jgi:hypothetical protein